MNDNNNTPIQTLATADQPIDDIRAIIADSTFQEPPETFPMAEMSIFRMLFHIFKNGMIGAITLTLCYGLVSVELVLMGHLDNSYILTSAKGNAIVLCNILYAPVLGFNCGLLVAMSRCIGLEDYKSIQHFKKIHFWFIQLSFIIVIVSSSIYIFACGWIYHDEVLYWTRIEIALVIPMIILII